VIYALVLIAIAATLYQILALVASLHHITGTEPNPEIPPRPVSILKPVHGLDPQFWESIVSHAEQDYPEFEILFGVSDPGDPAIPIIERLIASYPNRNIRLIRTHTELPNGKVGTLEELSSHTQYPVLVVNDSDILVPPGYLRRAVAPLSDPQVGVVTCLYRGDGAGWPARWESLGIATDFAPSVLVAPLLGVREFGLGSTLVFRAEHLRAIGGFRSFGDYIADDYQLAKRITDLGLRAVISKMVVETHPGDNTWAGVWRHQVRWARTIRACRGIAYFGLPVTHATLWAALCATNGLVGLAWLLFWARIAAGMTAGIAVLRSGAAARYFALIPLWDLWAFSIWIAGALSNTVVWRGKQMRLDRGGRIVSEQARAESSAT
jgi:ceramide glucosyltransferase